MDNNRSTDIKYLFGRAVRRRRRELDLSQEELAERSGLHRTYVSTVERGLRNPTLESIEQFAKALEINVSALFAYYGIEGEVQIPTRLQYDHEGERPSPPNQGA